MIVPPNASGTVPFDIFAIMLVKLTPEVNTKSENTATVLFVKEITFMLDGCGVNTLFICASEIIFLLNFFSFFKQKMSNLHKI